MRGADLEAALLLEIDQFLQTLTSGELMRMALIRASFAQQSDLTREACSYLGKRVRQTKASNSESACLTWIGAMTGDRYPTAKIGGRSRSLRRSMFEFVYGPLPRNWDVANICGNPRCIRPSHQVGQPRRVTSKKGRKAG